MPSDELTSRERVRLAFEHRDTDRVPIAMVCSGINEPARTAFDDLLKRERGIGLPEYLDVILDITSVGPEYVGPPLPPGQDMWGVVRAPVSHGAGSYDEICHCDLADAV